MEMIHSVAELRKIISRHRQDGNIITLVPTMGNLHEGHLQLVDKARSNNSLVVVSLFVNPLQFGENEDLEQYPRTLKQDAGKLQARGCDILFAPAVEEIYPASECNGRDQAQVTVPLISEILEGASRPGHFTGVATIVSKLFNLVQPDRAVFGEKDYQQLQIIRQMVEQLCFPVEILAVATVREDNGLAMSSRNTFLSPSQRQQAGLIYRLLQQMADELMAGETDFASLEEASCRTLNENGFSTDYIAIRASSLQPASTKTRELVILAAARLGSTRLIDNLRLQR